MRAKENGQINDDGTALDQSEVEVDETKLSASDIADTVLHILNLPSSIEVADILLRPVAQLT